MTAREHAKLLGLLFWVYAGISIVLIIVSMIFMSAMFGAMSAEMAKAPVSANQPNTTALVGMMGGIMIFALIFGLIMMIPDVVAGYGLRKGKSWAKIWTIIAAVLAALSFPLGTALAVYAFWFVFGDYGKNYFDNEGADSQSPPPPNGWQ